MASVGMTRRPRAPGLPLGLALAAPLAPLLIWQGRRVRKLTPKLPEADGAREGCVGSARPGEPLRLLILGDSSAAGVGAPDQDQALAGQLLHHLQARLHRPVRWKLVARTGIRTHEAIALLQAEPHEPFDLAVLALGVNDVTALQPPGAWLRDVRALAAYLRQAHGVSRQWWSGLPPMHRFPALPQPLRGVMGRHARDLDRALAHETTAPADHDGHWQHVPLPVMTHPGLMASDGFQDRKSVV
jgi:lysophospholipase L1-like esterase